jgi:hypothetical protein
VSAGAAVSRRRKKTRAKTPRRKGKTKSKNPYFQIISSSRLGGLAPWREKFFTQNFSEIKGQLA